MEDIEKRIQVIQKENKFILGKFQRYLGSKKLSKSTIEKHVANIGFFINDYLLRYDAIPAKEGFNRVDSFLGSWFIRKAMWASVTSIKENITSLKKFYQFMYEDGGISKDDLVELKEDIKSNKDEWLENLKMYDDPNIDFDDIW